MGGTQGDGMEGRESLWWRERDMEEEAKRKSRRRRKRGDVVSGGGRNGFENK